MAMQISRDYDYARTFYEEQAREKQAAGRADKAKEAGREADAGESGKLPGQRDEYISGEKSGQKPAGLYRVGKDDNGRRKIFFDDPNKADHADGKEQPKADVNRPGAGADDKERNVNGNLQGKPAEKCTGNTDRVEREIRKLKETKQRLEQQIQSASGDEEKVRELEKKLARVEQELIQKDNDTYRRRNTVFS